MSLAAAAAAHHSVAALRGLAIDMVEAAHSGHPGLPLGAAPMAYVLWRHHLSHAPSDPTWPNRDRFVLSAGHGSALLYALLHLSGYDLSEGDLRDFRRLGSRTPGHPEPALTPGVEVVTGPLGQGAANSVGLALGERLLAERFNRPGFALIDHRTFALLSDGDIMEGVCQEAAALAGHWQLGKLTWLYDSNNVTLDGPLSASVSEDTAARFVAMGWHVIEVPEGDTDLDALDQAMVAARAELGRPSLLIVRTTIGFGSPNKAGSNKSHGAPLGQDEASATKAALGLSSEPFTVCEVAAVHMRASHTLGLQRLSEWHGLLAHYRATHPALGKAFDRLCQEGPGKLGDDVGPLLGLHFTEACSTRRASQLALQRLSALLPELVGGDGDVAASTLSTIEHAGWVNPPDETAEAQRGCEPMRNIHYGVREHAMGAITNGLAAHGSVLPFAATFFAFSDYLRPSLRLSALARLPTLWLFTHDSIALGEDGPTHQPIEQLASLRAMPNLAVYRPADANETAASWQSAVLAAVAGGGPQALVLSRQTLPLLPAQAASEGVARGAYILRAPDGPAQPIDVVLLATGSEVHLALDARTHLARRHIVAQVVSMPCWERFAAQPAAYQQEVLGPEGQPRVAIEAASPLGWHRWVGTDGQVVGLEAFGQSGRGPEVLAACGLTVEAVARAAEAAIATNRMRLGSTTPRV